MKLFLVVSVADPVCSTLVESEALKVCTYTYVVIFVVDRYPRSEFLKSELKLFVEIHTFLMINLNLSLLDEGVNLIII